MLFEERLFYREKAFEQIEGQDFGLLDMWTSVLQFGKTDLDGLPIYPSEYYLKQVTSAVDHGNRPQPYIMNMFLRCMSPLRTIIYLINTQKC